MKYIYQCFLIIFFLFLINYKISINYIKLDNQLFNYENDTDFSKYKTDIKTIALYSPFNQNYIKNPLYINTQKKLVSDELINNLTFFKIENENNYKKKVEFAKRHGIYGFAIYLYWFSGKLYFKNFLNMLIINQFFNFHFLFIWKNENLIINSSNSNIRKEIIIKQEYKDEDPELFIKDICSFLIQPLYIKINNKPILGIFNPKEIPQLNKTIKIWRQKSFEYGIGKIYILININKKNISNIKNENYFDSLFYCYTLEESDELMKIKNQNYYLYSYLTHKNKKFKKIRIPIYRCSNLEFCNYYNKNSLSLYNYSPEHFYVLNKKLIGWTQAHHRKNYRFYFINSLNNCNEGNYLDPDIRYGYSSINSLSKAIFNLSYINQQNSSDLYKHNKIAIQVHVFYEDLIKEIIRKLNNIRFKFSLFISTDSNYKKDFIEKYINHLNNKSINIINYELIVIKNKGRDVLPFIIQLKNNFKKFKYICHIHTKKSLHSNIGDEWRRYLLFNLLGNNEIISEILTDFENNNKLGLIFPEIYYKIMMFFNTGISKSNLNKMNYIIKKIFPKVKIIDKFSEFPAGNMFWARISAIYQIFIINIEKKFPNELGQLDFTLMHAVERIWPYLTKLNGYYYKHIFKYY